MYSISDCRSRTAILLVSFSRFLRSRNSIELFPRLLRSALDTVTSRDDVTHDVKVSCILSRVVEVAQQLLGTLATNGLKLQKLDLSYLNVMLRCLKF